MGTPWTAYQPFLGLWWRSCWSWGGRGGCMGTQWAAPEPPRLRSALRLAYFPTSVHAHFSFFLFSSEKHHIFHMNTPEMREYFPCWSWRWQGGRMGTPWTASEHNLRLWWHSTCVCFYLFCVHVRALLWLLSVACAYAYGRLWLRLHVLECGGARGRCVHPMGRSGA